MSKQSMRAGSKVSVGTYRDDKLFPRVARAVDQVLAKGRVVAPVDVVVRSHTASYMRWGKKGPKRRLRFTKTGHSRLEEAYSTHFVRSDKETADPVRAFSPSPMEDKP